VKVGSSYRNTFAVVGFPGRGRGGAVDSPREWKGGRSRSWTRGQGQALREAAGADVHGGGEGHDHGGIRFQVGIAPLAQGDWFRQAHPDILRQKGGVAKLGGVDAGVVCREVGGVWSLLRPFQIGV